MRDGVVHAEADFISGVPPEAVSAHRVQWAQHAARVAAAVTARRRCEEAALYIVRASTLLATTGPLRGVRA